MSSARFKVRPSCGILVLGARRLIPPSEICCKQINNVRSIIDIDLSIAGPEEEGRNLIFILSLSTIHPNVD